MRSAIRSAFISPAVRSTIWPEPMPCSQSLKPRRSLPTKRSMRTSACSSLSLKPFDLGLSASGSSCAPRDTPGMMDCAFLWDTLTSLLTGVPLTLKLASGSVALGAVLALLLTATRMSPVAVLSWLARIYVFVFRGTPLLVQIFLIYSGLGQSRLVLQQLGLWTFMREPYWCALAALTLNTAAYSSEIVRGGLLAVPHEQIEAARACGMSGLLLFRRIVFPIALRQALPAYGNEVILMIK